MLKSVEIHFLFLLKKVAFFYIIYSKVVVIQMIKISNLTFSNEPILGIVLDRGGAIKGNIIDFLVEERSEAYDDIGRQRNVIFEIIRWGW